MLRHLISSKGLEVDQEKITTIRTLVPRTTMRGIRSFLGHTGFYRRFIKDFSKFARPLCKLLEKDAIFSFDETCMEAFQVIKEKPISAPNVIMPNLGEPFKLLCNAINYAIGSMLGQVRENIFKAIYYASRTLNKA